MCVAYTAAGLDATLVIDRCLLKDIQQHDKDSQSPMKRLKQSPRAIAPDTPTGTGQGAATVVTPFTLGRPLCSITDSEGSVEHDDAVDDEASPQPQRPRTPPAHLTPRYLVVYPGPRPSTPPATCSISLSDCLPRLSQHSSVSPLPLSPSRFRFGNRGPTPPLETTCDMAPDSPPALAAPAATTQDARRSASPSPATPPHPGTAASGNNSDDPGSAVFDDDSDGDGGTDSDNNSDETDGTVSDSISDETGGTASDSNSDGTSRMLTDSNSDSDADLESDDCVSSNLGELETDDETTVDATVSGGSAADYIPGHDAATGAAAMVGVEHDSVAGVGDSDATSGEQGSGAGDTSSESEAPARVGSTVGDNAAVKNSGEQ